MFSYFFPHIKCAITRILYNLFLMRFSCNYFSLSQLNRYFYYWGKHYNTEWVNSNKSRNLECKEEKEKEEEQELKEERW